MRSLSEFMNSQLSTYIYSEDQTFLNFKHCAYYDAKVYLEEQKQKSNKKRVDILIGLADDLLLGRLSSILQHVNLDENNVMVLVDDLPSNLDEEQVTLIVQFYA